MSAEALMAIGPVDGRYRSQTLPLGKYFSEFGLIRYRLVTEVEYFIALCALPLPQLAHQLSDQHAEALRDVYRSFSQEDAEAIKHYEKTTNHDVKAVEYFLKDQMKKVGLGAQTEFIHFGLTSQDINNTAIPMSIRDGVQKVILPKVESLLATLHVQAESWKKIPMLARTHGQPASPTLLGKEWMVFIDRLNQQLAMLKQVPYSAKFGGATGNFNAHHVAYPTVDWVEFANHFVNKTLGLNRSAYTTQIEHYDHLAALFDGFKRIDTILIDLCRDCWQYIAMDYFKQQLKAGEIGSSAMPHKVNPIDFENAEGNLGMANAIFEHLSAKLPISRLQRDLTDSTVLRNVGVPFAHLLIALNSLEKGLSKLMLNPDKLHADLESSWAVVAEAIQTILRREGYNQPYEALKGLTRTNQAITQNDIHNFIANLPISDAVKKELLAITPHNYTGVYGA